MKWPADASNSSDLFDDVAPGVSRVRPAVFRALDSTAPTAQGLTALQAYDSARPHGQEARTGAVSTVTAMRERTATGARKAATKAPPATNAPSVTPSEMEQRLAPLRGISRELVGRGMPSSLVAELLAEIVAEYGNQVLVSERDARLALVEVLLDRIPCKPLIIPAEELDGIFVVTGQSGAGKSVLISHLALAAARRGQRNVVLVNTESNRIGAAAQMNALGEVFGYQVAHVYTPQELRELVSELGRDALVLVETAGWSPREGEGAQRQPWKWQLPTAQIVTCIPATGQAENVEEVLTTTRQMTSGALAVLTRLSETRNVLPALGALAHSRQALGMIVPGPNLAANVAPPDLGDVAHAALGVVLPQPRKGRVRW